MELGDKGARVERGGGLLGERSYRYPGHEASMAPSC